MGYRYKNLFFVFFLLTFRLVNAQSIHSETFSVGDGLSQSNINYILQDSHGFLWVATQDGLNRYDGYDFKTYKHDPGDNNSISNNYINHLMEDHKGNIWIATNLGLNKYNPSRNTFTTYYASDTSSNSLPQNQVFYLYEDSEGIIWIKTLYYLSKFNPETGQFRNYKHFNDYFNFYNGTNNYAILEDRSGNLWVGTKDGLNIFDEKLEVFKRYYHKPSDPNSLSNNRVQDIYEDRDGSIWVATENGLNKYIPGKDHFKRYFLESRVGGLVAGNSINFIFRDLEGILWVGSDAGLFKFDEHTGQFTSAVQFLDKSNRPLIGQIRAIEQKRENVIWIGTLQGLIKFQKSLKDFTLYNKDSSGNLLFGDNIVASVFHDTEREVIWVGTWDEGLFLYNEKSGKVRHFSQTSGIIPDNDVHALFKDDQNRLWLGTQNGVCYYDFNRQRFVDFTWQGASNPDIFKDNRVYDIVQDHQGNIWFGTRNGLHMWNGKDLKSYFHTSYDPNSLTSSFVYDLLVDEKNHLWIATNKGLNRYIQKRDAFIRYKRDKMTCENCLVNNEVLSLHSSGDFLWIGTVSGLNRLDVKNNQFTTYTEQDGLPNNMIYAILEDDHENLWISTNLGITKFNPETTRFFNYGPSDGLQNYEFNHLAAYKNKNGKMFFGGISGLNAFYPDSVKRSNHIPNIVISSIEVFTNKRRFEYNLIGNDSIDIPYKSNLVTIEFSALDLAEPGKNKYAYKLDYNSDNEWVYVGERRYATFSNLPSGKYSFHVKGSNNDEVWNEEGATLHLTVETPFWKNNLFYTLYVILGISLILLIIRWRTNRLRVANQRLKEREVIAQQVAKQKEELSVKNKNITDSLIYAKRIQESLLPSDLTFKSLLSNSFIFYKPKDIVSGDFYWINENENKLFIAVVDCTGHGVPGAFMSIIGVELLNSITNDQGVEEANRILYDLNKGISLALSNDESQEKSIKDGMDIALCVIDKKNQTMEYAGAFRPLYLIRDNKIEEIKGDRFSVGMLEESMDSPHIKKHTLHFQKDDIIYLFTDGYADQFGGPDGKKYKYRRFRYLLLTIHKLPMEQQKEYIEKSIEEWKGEHEQVDDMLIVGFRPFQDRIH